MKQKLLSIQLQLKAPKSQLNKFGNYKYRNAEDILESVKPLLGKQDCILTLTDEVVSINNRFYVKATATLSDIKSEGSISVSAYAREEESKKGMDGSQITGASSSYARKYALNGLFAIDDAKDSDFTNKHGKDEEFHTEAEAPSWNKNYSETQQYTKPQLKKKLSEIPSVEKLVNFYREMTKEQQDDKEIIVWYKLRKAQLEDEGKTT